MEDTPIFSSYVILNQIGLGGMATVYLAEHKTLGHSVAIKVLNKEFTFNQNIRSRFVEEAKKMVRMNHPNVVKVTDLIDEENTVAIVMEYVDGKTLTALSAEHKFTDEEIELYLKQMLQALFYIHNQGVIHRDIKPSNFILGKDGHLKLTDFGISKSFLINSDFTQTSTSMSLGTPMYMSPEQVRSTKDVTQLTDIYSLGVVLWQLVSGKKPYSSETTSAFDLQLKIVQQDLPFTHTHWDSIIQKATQKEENMRFQSAEEFLMALENKEIVENDFERTIISQKVVLTQKKILYKPETVDQKGKKKKRFVYLSLTFLLLLISIPILIFKDQINSKNPIIEKSNSILNAKVVKTEGNTPDSKITSKKIVTSDTATKKEINLKTIDSYTSYYGTTKVISVERTKKFTIVKMRDENLVKDSWIIMDPNAYIIDKQNNKKLFISAVYGIPFSPLKRYATYKNQTIDFELYFPAVSENCTTIDFVENSTSEWKFYNLKVIKVNNKSDKDILAKIERGKNEDDERRKDYEREKEREEELATKEKIEIENNKYKKLEFKNNSNQVTIYLAIVYYDGSDWVTKGWYNVKTSDSFVFSLPYNYGASSFYYYAEAGKTTWSGGEKINKCINPTNSFSYYDNINHPCPETKSFTKKTITDKITYITFGN